MIHASGDPPPGCAMVAGAAAPEWPLGALPAGVDVVVDAELPGEEVPAGAVAVCVPELPDPLVPDGELPLVDATTCPDPGVPLLVVDAGAVTSRTADSDCPPPVARIVYVPGEVDAGITTGVVNPPEPSVVAEPRLVPSGLMVRATAV